MFNTSRNKVSRLSAKVIQVYPRNKWRSVGFLNLDSYLDSWYLSRFKSCWSPILDNFLTDKLSIKVNENQLFRADFSLIREYMFELSFLTTQNMYKDFFKGRQRLRKCEEKLCSCKLWPETEFTLVHLSLEEAAVFVHLRVLWPMSFMVFIVWWIEELCSQHLFQVGD